MYNQPPPYGYPPPNYGGYPPNYPPPNYGAPPANTPPPNPSKVFRYQFDGDANGLVSYIGTTTLKVISSSQSVGKAQDFVSREKVRCWTKNQPFSWFLIDLGDSKKFNVTHYTLRYASPGTNCCPRFWILQGSNYVSSATYKNMDPRSDPEWITIGMHINDKSLSADWATRTWAIPQNAHAFRYFRVVHTGKNSFDAKGQADEWSDVFVAGGFELYGYLYDSYGQPQLQSQPYVQPYQQPPQQYQPPPQQYQPPPQQYQPPPQQKPPQQIIQQKPAIKDPDVFDWDHDMDGSGIITHLGKTKVKVIASSVVQGKVEDFVSTDKVTLWTRCEPYSWFCVDFGDEILLEPSTYTLRYTSSGNSCCPRNWILQGSNEPPTAYMRDPTHDPNWIKWTNLCIHINDTNLNSDFATCSWIVKPPKDNNKFRYFRVIQTGKNGFAIPKDGKDEWSDVFVVGSFEIYGNP